MRVLIVARWYPSHDSPGRGSFVADLVESLLGQACDVRVASFDVARYARETPAETVAEAVALWSAAVARPEVLSTPRHWGVGVPVARLPAIHPTPESVAQQVDGHAGSLLAFGRSLHERWPFDVIHAHTGIPDGLAAIRLSRAVGVPLMVTEHDRSLRERLPESQEARDAYRSLLRDAHLTVAVSGKYRDLLCAALEVPASAIGVIPNPIPEVFFEGAIDAARDDDQLLYVGSRKESKGIITLLDAFAATHAARPSLRLRLIGSADTPEDDLRWRSLAHDLGIGDHVSFDLPGDRATVARAMRRASVFVHPSPFESFGMVAAEALASGLPVAATPSGIEEIVGTDGRFGTIAETPDAVSLSRAILTVLERRDRYVADDLRTGASRFRESRVARETMDRYETIMSKDRAVRARTPASYGEPVQSIGREPPAGFDGALLIGQNAMLAERRLGTLTPELRRRIVLLTRRPSATLRDANPGRVVEMDPRRAYAERLAALGSPPGVRWSAPRRVLNFLRSPRRALERRRLRRNRERVVLELGRAQVLEVWQGLAHEGKRAVVIPLDVEDVAHVTLTLQHGAALAPGLTRWLADRWDERYETAGRTGS